MSLIRLFVCVLSLQAVPADLVIENARIWSDGFVGFAEFAAVRDGRFVYVGARHADLIGERTEVIDARGRVVVPGLIDSHIHMLGGGLQLLRLHLRDAADRQEFVRRVTEHATGLPPGAWILGGRWSTESWSDPEQPTRAWVDDAVGEHPLFLSRMDGHSALVNTAALALAGITAQGPPDPIGGVIDRDTLTGEPTGILRDTAMGLVSRYIPATTLQEKVGALRRAASKALEHGITAVSDIPSLEDLPAYARLAETETDVRFYLYVTAGDWRDAVQRVRSFPQQPGRVEIRGMKTYLDGSMGSRTAYMREPYLGNDSSRPGWRGLLRDGVEDGQLAARYHVARRAGLQPIAHAIGDEANHILLDILRDVYRDDLAAARCRAEHVQHLLPGDIARFGALGVIASMQPYHKADDGRYAERYIGPQRARSSYAYKSLLDTGAVVVFGSDWPVVSLNPFLGMEAAVTGRILDGGTWQTQQNITVAEALRCYTSSAAWAMFAENEIGRIARGLRADFVILDRSPFDPDVDWSAIRPVRVFVGGKRGRGDGGTGEK
ncbi:MAG: amidohydrolase [Planctomycetes bacterium]|nr:amidohydrolase [Planctomycetota bacterium]